MEEGNAGIVQEGLVLLGRIGQGEDVVVVGGDGNDGVDLAGDGAHDDGGGGGGLTHRVGEELVHVTLQVGVDREEDARPPSGAVCSMVVMRSPWASTSVMDVPGFPRRADS